ncbi:hypothetical protein A9G48_03390 [Gilliamella sp. wkB18]|uniref:hypothetical protein n=1 Tax=Gilliamella sp. wkB18 TaxID=3120260 RepID=UPI00068BA599|nr:hypothetical protein [Gilliamella apicola]OCG64290.1 hypothetical protein A9G48_03390 [Gilliamella apicola]
MVFINRDTRIFKSDSSNYDNWTCFLLLVLLNVNVSAIAAVIYTLLLINAAYIGHCVHAGIIVIGKDQ